MTPADTPRTDADEQLREKLRDLPRTQRTDPRYPIDAYEDDLVQLIKADREQAVVEARIDENRKIRIDLANVRFAAMASMEVMKIKGIDECVDAADDRYKALTAPSTAKGDKE